MFKGFDVTPVTRGLTQTLGVVYSDAGILETAPFLKSLIFWLECEPKDLGDMCHYLSSASFTLALLRSLLLLPCLRLGLIGI